MICAPTCAATGSLGTGAPTLRLVRLRKCIQQVVEGGLCMSIELAHLGLPLPKALVTLDPDG